MNITNMKKYCSILMAFAICLTFVACSKGESSTVSGTAQSQTASSAESSSTQSEVSSSANVQSEIGTSSPAQSSQTPGQSNATSHAESQAGSQSPASSSQPVKPTTVRIVIPEGYTLSQIGDRLEVNGVCKKKDLLSKANSYDFSYYSQIGKLSSNANRCYKVEGYLFPDTYDFYLNMSAQDALGKMLKNAEGKIGSNYSYSGMSTDQVVALASIIEKEAAGAAEMKKISSVFHNRLNAGMRLQADPTIIYIEKYVKPNLTGDINRYNSFYNTYKCAALPTGAICNPGKAALSAAANPDSTEYLYFAADKSGNYYYAKTFDEHKANLAKANIVVGNSMQ